MTLASAPSSPDSGAPPLIDDVAQLTGATFPELPFGVRRGDGGVLHLQRILRQLPGKRIAAEAFAGERHVLAKLFLGRGSGRYAARETAGIGHLHTAGLPTPQLVGSEALPGGGHLVMTEFLPDTPSVLSLWRPLAGQAAGGEAAIAALAPVFRVLGRMHHAGLTHEDVHLGNFLRCGEEIVIVDGDAVRKHAAAPVHESEARRNLGMLIAQLPIDWDGELAPLLNAYRGGNPGLRASPDTLHAAIAQARNDRLADYLSKTRRDCTRFQVESGLRRLSIVAREQAPQLTPLLADPDRWISADVLLKDGRTATVARVELDGLMLVVKRYNIKNRLHALSRAPRPSRAWHAWTEGHRLKLLGIPTPAPLAVIEERFGPLRGRAWLIAEFCAGVSLRQHFNDRHDDTPSPAEAAALQSLFTTLHQARITHGDLKSQNLLWHDGRITLIDLDAMVQHRSAAAHQRAWRKDRARFLRNWPQDSALVTWLNANLPPAP